MIRLGDGTELSHQRAQVALEGEWPHLDELFAPLDPVLAASGTAVDPAGLRDGVLHRITDVLAAATLAVPQVESAGGAGRLGRHTEEMEPLLAEMQQLHRAHPGVSW